MSLLEHWALLSICYSPWNVGLTIRAVTNHPCHLTLLYTSKKPLKHRLTRIIRGLPTMWDAYHCFVSYTPIDQNEAGDTLEHTFYISPWAEGSHKYWTLLATINGIDSPSTCPIFDYTHPGGTARQYIVFPVAPGNICYLPYGTPYACPDHYKNVNESPPDEDLSYVSSRGGHLGWFQYDTYSYSPVPFSNIESVTLVTRLKRVNGYPYHLIAGIQIYTYNTYYSSPVFSPLPYYSYFGWTWTTNPFTGNYWTQSEVNSLKAGPSLATIAYTGGTTWANCTQCYLLITQAPCTPVVNPGPYP